MNNANFVALVGELASLRAFGPFRDGATAYNAAGAKFPGRPVTIVRLEAAPGAHAEPILEAAGLRASYVKTLGVPGIRVPLDDANRLRKALSEYLADHPDKLQSLRSVAGVSENSVRGFLTGLVKRPQARVADAMTDWLIRQADLEQQEPGLGRAKAQDPVNSILAMIELIGITSPAELASLAGSSLEDAQAAFAGLSQPASILSWVNAQNSFEEQARSILEGQ